MGEHLGRRFIERPRIVWELEDGCRMQDSYPVVELVSWILLPPLIKSFRLVYLDYLVSVFCCKVSVKIAASL
jgi:hypothetical protein